jgi:hypothetical protein
VKRLAGLASEGVELHFTSTQPKRRQPWEADCRYCGSTDLTRIDAGRTEQCVSCGRIWKAPLPLWVDLMADVLIRGDVEFTVERDGPTQLPLYPRGGNMTTGEKIAALNTWTAAALTFGIAANESPFNGATSTPTKAPRPRVLAARRKVDRAIAQTRLLLDARGDHAT